MSEGDSYVDFRGPSMLQPRQHAGGPEAGRLRLPHYLFLAAVFAMPFVSFRSEMNVVQTLWDRAVLADVFGGLAILLTGLMLMPRMVRAWKRHEGFMLASLAFFLVAAMSVMKAPPDYSLSTTAMLAGTIIMGYLLAYCAAGITLVDTERMIRLVCLAWLFGAAVEGLIILHDTAGIFGIGQVWFYHGVEHRLRGTFRTCGQLGQYAFMSAIVLFAAASLPRLGRRARILAYFTCGVMMLATVLASRRSAMFSVLIWLALLILSGRKAWKATYSRPVLITIAVVTLGISLLRSDPEVSRYIAGRTTSAYGRWESFFGGQLRQAFDILEEHPLLGCGIGLSESALGPAEIHCGPLAILAETGVLGFTVFLLLLWHVYRRVLGNVRLARDTAYEAMTVRLGCAFAAMAPFWLHNRPHRDRAFWTAIIITFALSKVLNSKWTAGTTQPLPPPGRTYPESFAARERPGTDSAGMTP